MQGEMPVEKSVVVARVRPLADQLPQSPRLFYDVQLAGVASHPGEEQDLGGTGDPDSRRGEACGAAGDHGQGDAGVRAVAVGVADAEAEQGAVGGE